MSHCLVGCASHTAPSVHLGVRARIQASGSFSFYRGESLKNKENAGHVAWGNLMVGGANLRF